jgi:hypothetical protein
MGSGETTDTHMKIEPTDEALSARQKTNPPLTLLKTGRVRRVGPEPSIRYHFCPRLQVTDGRRLACFAVRGAEKRS